MNTSALILLLVGLTSLESLADDQCICYYSTDSQYNELKALYGSTSTNGQSTGSTSNNEQSSGDSSNNSQSTGSSSGNGEGSGNVEVNGEYSGNYSSNGEYSGDTSLNGDYSGGSSGLFGDVFSTEWQYGDSYYGGYGNYGNYGGYNGGYSWDYSGNYSGQYGGGSSSSGDYSGNYGTDGQYSGSGSINEEYNGSSSGNEEVSGNSSNTGEYSGSSSSNGQYNGSYSSKGQYNGSTSTNYQNYGNDFYIDNSSPDKICICNWTTNGHSTGSTSNNSENSGSTSTNDQNSGSTSTSGGNTGSTSTNNGNTGSTSNNSTNSGSTPNNEQNPGTSSPNDPYHCNDQMTRCGTKLDSLCIFNLIDVVNEYRNNVTSIMKNLQNRITARVELYTKTRGNIIYNRRLFLIENTRWLFNRINRIVIDNRNAKAALYTCEQGMSIEVADYQIPILDYVNACKNNSNVDLSPFNSPIASLKNSAMAASNNVCNCVKDINSSSSEAAKESAKKCARDAAAALNSAPVQAQANVIFSEVDSRVVATRAAFDACMANDGTVTKRDAIYTKINNCLKL